MVWLNPRNSCVNELLFLKKYKRIIICFNGFLEEIRTQAMNNQKIATKLDCMFVLKSLLFYGKLMFNSVILSFDVNTN